MTLLPAAEQVGATKANFKLLRCVSLLSGVLAVVICLCAFIRAVSSRVRGPNVSPQGGREGQILLLPCSQVTACLANSLQSFRPDAILYTSAY